jgi:hypothetical protein
MAIHAQAENSFCTSLDGEIVGSLRQCVSPDFMGLVKANITTVVNNDATKEKRQMICLSLNLRDREVPKENSLNTRLRNFCGERVERLAL